METRGAILVIAVSSSTNDGADEPAVLRDEEALEESLELVFVVAAVEVLVVISSWWFSRAMANRALEFLTAAALGDGRSALLLVTLPKLEFASLPLNRAY